MKVPLRTKLVVAVTLPALLICSAVIGVTTVRLRARAIERIEENAARIAEIYSDRVGAELDGIAVLARSMATQLQRHPTATEDEVKELVISSVMAGELVEDGAVFLLPGGTEPASRATEPVLLLVPEDGGRENGLSRWPQVAGRPTWFETALAADQGVWLPAFRPEGPPTPARVIHAVAWRDEQGNPAGGVALEFDMAALRARLGAIITDSDLVILDSHGTYLYHPSPDTAGTLSIFKLAVRVGRPDIAELGRQATSGESGVMRLPNLSDDTHVWLIWAPIPGTDWTFGYSTTQERVLAFPNSQLWLGTIITGVGLLLITALIYMVASRSTAPLHRLAVAVDRISHGDLDARVEDVHTHDEIGDLARAFNIMVADLRHYMDTHSRELAAREAVESELRVARRIQNSLLPGNFPAYPERPEFQLHAVNMPASQVAGDFFDFFFRDERTLVVIMADVSGKGVPAALFMAVARTVIRNLTGHCDGPAATLRQANEILREDNVGSMFVTLFLGWYDTVSGRLRYANAGHPRPCLVNVDGHAASVGEVTGPILGILPGQDYTDGEISLEPGESLVLYTDGLSEARDPAGEFFGNERLARLIESQAGEPVDRLCEAVAQAVGRFQDREQKDDITLLALRRSLRATQAA
ncbi:MAG: SpoIIE family protein phosphatase [Acidobacteria bacterium]|nr:SpoIIE family protein phosphatase [Acidobacteriota bacterium]